MRLKKHVDCGNEPMRSQGTVARAYGFHCSQLDVENSMRASQMALGAHDLGAIACDLCDDDKQLPADSLLAVFEAYRQKDRSMDSQATYHASTAQKPDVKHRRRVLKATSTK